MATTNRAASASERVFQWRAGAGAGHCCTPTRHPSSTCTNGSAPLPFEYDYFGANQNQNPNHRRRRNLVWINPNLNLNPANSNSSCNSNGRRSLNPHSNPNPNPNPTLALSGKLRGNHRSLVWLNPDTATATATATSTATVTAIATATSTSTSSSSTTGSSTGCGTNTTTTRGDEIAVASNAPAASNAPVPAPASASNTPCKQFLSGCCPFAADSCHYLHTWSLGKDFSILTACHAHQHQKTIQAIQLPSPSDHLYSVTSDGILNTWNYNTGQCAATAHLAGQVGSMLSHGPWLIVGMHDSIKAGNIQTGAEMYLSGPTGLVSALAADGNLLFAGTQDGRILIWRLSTASNLYEPAACLVGHCLAVMSIILQGATLYSASLDSTIKEWNLTTLQCVHTLSDHTKGVMALLSWNQFLISCSLDNTVKVWNKNNEGKLELTYTHTEEHGLLGLCGMNDLHGTPVLFASLSDYSVRLFDLPSFEERGRIFAKEEVRAMLTGPDGLFFIGDGAGELKVWRWSTE
ncbi:Zinc finger CCCH domain-containing protein [Rhynchospora pubera]|uniref:Zinc finger CCCH domain-containing protein n=1 Tax=Rhynchospora pubera TaxID=906938 RepID=A0AAV8E3Z7_9POAL|nr:Zinc finger CCCH domain-containing protein [Rhynchospora pubera]